MATKRAKRTGEPQIRPSKVEDWQRKSGQMKQRERAFLNQKKEERGVHQPESSAQKDDD